MSTTPSTVPPAGGTRFTNEEIARLRRRDRVSEIAISQVLDRRAIAARNKTTLDERRLFAYLLDEAREDGLGKAKANRPLTVLSLEPDELESLLFGRNVPDENRWAYEALVAQVEGKSAIRSRDWLGGIKSMQDVLRLTREGWGEGAQRALALSESLKRELPAPKSRRRRGEWGDEGDELDRDRLTNGDLEHAWRRTRRVVRSGLQVVTVVAPFGVPGSWNQEQLFWTGAAMIVLADILDDAGFTLELVAASPTVMTAGDILTVCQLKHPGDPLRPDIVAALFCHAGVSRCMDFFAALHAPFAIRRDFGAAGDLGVSWEAARRAGLVEPATLLLDRVRNEQACRKMAHGALAALVAADESGVPREDDDPPLRPEGFAQDPSY